jgi:Carbohydrate esterase, sialic acid-specific acetylesterase
MEGASAMSQPSILQIAILSIACAVNALAQTTSPTPSTKPAPVVVAPPVKDSFDVYLLMGQSNMVGRDTTTLAAQVDHPNILAMDGQGRWVMARDPLHEDARIPPGVGPGMSFAVEMLKANPNRTIGLVPCAVGGTPLSRWVKGADLYEQAVGRAKIAAQAGVIRGMLWHQGESDTASKENADSYEARLTQMFKDLRGELGLATMPIVVGQLGPFLTVEKYPYLKTVEGAIEHIPAVVSNAGYADSAGLADRGDQLHFSAAAQTEFGARYAKAMLKLKK